MSTRTKRLIKTPEKYVPQGFENCWSPRTIKKPSPKQPKKAAPIFYPRGIAKNRSAAMIPNCTLLTNSRQLGKILEGSRCNMPKCQSVRRVVSFEVDIHGGCGVFELICGKGHFDLFETGTKYDAVENDGRTKRYAEATLFIVGNLFSGSGEIGYQEMCSALGMHGFSTQSNVDYFWRLYQAAEVVFEESKAKCHGRLKDLGQWE